MEKEVKDDYLWDGSGEPDPEVQKLETLLARLRHNQPAPEFPAYAAAPRGSRWRQLFARYQLRWAAAAATLVVAATAVWLLRPNPVAVSEGWEVSRIEGAPRVGTSTVRAAASAKLGVGQVLEPTISPVPGSPHRTPAKSWSGPELACVCLITDREQNG